MNNNKLISIKSYLVEFKIKLSNYECLLFKTISNFKWHNKLLYMSYFFKAHINCMIFVISYYCEGD